MQDMPKAQISAEERATIFHEQYGNDVDAGDTLAEIVIAAGNYLARIVGDADADAGMARVVEPMLGERKLSNSSDWRKALDQERMNCLEWPIGARLHDLAAYAVYGIVLDGSHNAEERAEESGEGG